MVLEYLTKEMEKKDIRHEGMRIGGEKVVTEKDILREKILH